MSGLDPARRNRLRLWLRGERAFGLSSVRAVPEAEQEQALGALSAVPPPVVQQRTPPRQPQSVVPKSLTPQIPQAPPMPKRGTASSPQQQPVLVPSSISAPFDASPLSTDQKITRLAVMNDAEVSVCTKCRLHATRTNTVFGEGNPEARIFFIGEGPGENEDLTGRPFVGKAGQLLDRMITGGMGLKREDVFIANIVKCRPPGNRVPAPDEVATCTPYLVRQLEIIRPQVIVTLGRPAANYMLGTNLAMGKMRGEWQSWRGIKLMPTFHPSYVLRSYTEEVRAAVWSDLKKVLVELGLPVPSRRGS